MRTILPLKAIRRLALAATRYQRAMTLGVRVVARDADGAILLVRHTYLRGWYLPGGAVDAGETLAEAALRELREETGVLPGAGAAPELFAIYHNRRDHLRDHVALYRLSAVLVPEGALRPNREIREARFFAVDALPEETTPATRRRLAELAGESEIAPLW
jgi:ADP-ribose pyrophosphatase YjhB (NUDIX family)